LNESSEAGLNQGWIDAKPKEIEMPEIVGEPASERLSDLDISMGYLVRRTFRAFTRALELRLVGHDISLSMWFFLRLLWIQDGQTQKELSDELGLTPATTVSAMDGMEARGFIERRRSREDRRKVYIYLTVAGRALEKQLSPYASEVNEIALETLSSEERRVVTELLQRINRSLNAEIALREPQSRSTG
jgi:DNA-binding MarR family transcriptional regulator